MLQFSLFVTYITSCLTAGVFIAALPPQTCPQYFQYLTEGDQFVGKLTLPELPNEMLIAEIRFSLHEFANNNFVGNLTLWSDVETAYKKLENSEPLDYRVIFSTQKELPKVTLIAVNGIEICTAENYPEPSEKIYLRYWLTPPEAKRRKVPPPPEGFEVKTKFGTPSET